MMMFSWFRATLTALTWLREEDELIRIWSKSECEFKRGGMTTNSV
jgi:hypothetical protein